MHSSVVQLQDGLGGNNFQCLSNKSFAAAALMSEKLNFSAKKWKYKRWLFYSIHAQAWLTSWSRLKDLWNTFTVLGLLRLNLTKNFTEGYHSQTSVKINKDIWMLSYNCLFDLRVQHLNSWNQSNLKTHRRHRQDHVLSMTYCVFLTVFHSYLLWLNLY